MKHPKKYLDKSGSQMFDLDMMLSCSSRSSGASSGHQPSPEPDLVLQQSSETPELPLEAQQQTVPEEALQQSAEEPTQPIASNEKKVLNKF